MMAVSLDETLGNILDHATSINNKIIVAEVLQHYVTTKDLMRALMNAVSSNHEEIAFMLIPKLVARKDANINDYFAPPHDGSIRSPLLYAARNRNVHLIKALVHAGADPNVYDAYGRTTIDYLLRDSRPSSSVTLNYLLDHGAEITEEQIEKTIRKNKEIDNGKLTTVIAKMQAQLVKNTQQTYPSLSKPVKAVPKKVSAKQTLVKRKQPTTRRRSARLQRVY